MNKISLTLITVIVGILLIFTFLQMERPAFEIENKFIVVPQNSIVADDMSNVINNIVEIASDQQNDELIENKRAIVEAERLNETSMFKINVFGQTEKDAKELSEAVIYNILKDVSKYYDVKTDINVELVKGDNVVQNDLNKVLPIIFWLLVGILISILIVMIVELVAPKKNSNKKVIDLRNVINNVDSNREVTSNNAKIQNVESTPVYNLQDSVNTNYEFNSFQNRELEEVNKVEDEKIEQEKNEEKKFVSEKRVVEVESKKDELIQSEKIVSQPIQMVKANSGVSRSGAPSNLPVVEFNAESGSDDEMINESPQSSNSENVSDEPTEEELKARLNKLLKGEM